MGTKDAVLRYLTRRYGADCTPSTAAPAAGEPVEVARVYFTPSDPSLPVGVGRMCVCVSVSPARLCVENAEALPDVMIAALNKLIDAHMRAQAGRGIDDETLIRSTLKWLENHLSSHLRTLIELQQSAFTHVAETHTGVSAGVGVLTTSPSATGAVPATSTAASPAAVTSPSGKARRDDGVGESGTAARDDSSAATVRLAEPSRMISPPGADESRAQSESAAYTHGAVETVPAAPTSIFAAPWAHDEHLRLESILRDVFMSGVGRPLTDVKAWHDVASRLGSGRTPAECLARFLVARRIAQRWDAAVHEHAPVISVPAVVPVASAVDEPVKPEPSASAPAAPSVTLSNESAMRRDSAEVDGVTYEDGFDYEGDHYFAPAESRAAHAHAESTDSDEDNAHDYSLDWLPAGRRGYRTRAPRRTTSRAAGRAAAHAEPGSAPDEEKAAQAAADADADADEYAVESPAFQRIHLDPAHRGAQIILERLNIYGIGTIAASRVAVLAQCQRCSLPIEASMEGAALGGSPRAGGASDTAPEPEQHWPQCEYKAWCRKCALLHTMYFRPTLVHEGNPSLGYVDTTNVAVTSLKDCSLFVTCLECGVAADLARFAPPAVWEASCRSCFSRMRLDARGARIEMAQGEGSAARLAPAATEKARIRTERLQVGKPLPANGTCKHYGHSYRWLRFPCCGLAYPCDVCHDDASDHPHEWARRMICGHCAREQPFSNAPCVACGRLTTRSSGPAPRHWEGGQGQRNRNLMSRKDSRKYADSKLKTHSKKHLRVGAAGAAVRKKEAAAEH